MGAQTPRVSPTFSVLRMTSPDSLTLFIFFCKDTVKSPPMSEMSAPPSPRILICSELAITGYGGVWFRQTAQPRRRHVQPVGLVVLKSRDVSRRREMTLRSTAGGEDDARRRGLLAGHSPSTDWTIHGVRACAVRLSVPAVVVTCPYVSTHAVAVVVVGRLSHGSADYHHSHGHPPSTIARQPPFWPTVARRHPKKNSTPTPHAGMVLFAGKTV